MKVKILKTRSFDTSIEPVSYPFWMEKRNLKIYGDIIVDFIAEEITLKTNYVEVKCTIEDSAEREELENYGKYHYSKIERLMILKEIFYSFCLSKAKLFSKNVCDSVEKFSFKILGQDEEENPSIISQLLSYGYKFYNPDLKRERVIANIVMSVYMIEKKSKEKNTVYLQKLKGFDGLEVAAYIEIINKYLSDLGYCGAVTLNEAEKRAIYSY